MLALDPAGDALVHGDLGGGNLLWTATEAGPRLTGILDWDGARIGHQADDLASIAVTVGWPLAERIDAARHGGDTPTIAAATAIAATFALQQALPGRPQRRRRQPRRRSHPVHRPRVNRGSPPLGTRVLQPGTNGG